MGWNRIMSSEHQNGIVTGNGTQTEQALRASELSYRRPFETAEDGILILDVDKKVIRCNIRDIPERKRAEAVLRESEQRFEALFEGAREGVFQSTLGGQFRLANPALARMLGYASSQELIAGVTDIGRQLNVDTGVRAEFQRRITERGEVQDFEFQARRKDGATIWLSENAHAVRDASGAVLYYEGMLQDITERKQAEELLHHEQTLMATLMGNIPDGVYFKDTASRFLRVNSAQSRKFGLSDPAQIVGKSDADFFSGEHARQALADEQEIIRTGRPLLNVEEKETWPDGTVGWVLTTKLPMRDAAGRIIGTCGISRDITGRKRAEEAVRESERRFQTLANTSPVGIFRTDAQGQTTYVNPRWCQITGLSATDALGDRWLHAVHPEDREKLVQGWQAATQVQSTSKADYRFVHPDGTISWVIGQAVPEKDDAGRIVGYVGTVTDITERKQMELISTRLAAIIEFSDDAIIGKGLDGIITSWNKGAEKIFGFSADEMVGNSIMRLIPADRPDEENHILEKINCGESVEHFETLRQTKDGRLIDISVTVSPIKDATGKVVGVSKVARDITERKQMERALRESQAFYHSLVDQLPAGIFRKDPEGRYMFVSPWFCRLKGMKAEKFLGKTAQEVAGSEAAQQDATGRAVKYAAHGEDHHHLIMRTGKPIELVEEYATADGQKQFVHAIKFPVINPGGKVSGTQGILFDITERKRAEGALRSSEERFRIAAETANDVIYEWDLKQSVEWLGKIDDLLGYEPGEFPRTMKSFAASVHPEDLERTMAAIQAHLDGRVPYAVEYRVRRKDGVYRWWSARGAVARTPDGKPTRWIGSITDFTERKQAEERLTQEHDLSEAILNNIPGLFYLITEKGRFLRWNRQLETVSGYSGEEIARMHPLDIVPAEHKGLVAEQILQVFKTGRSKVEANLLTKQGEQLPFYFTGGTVIVDGQPCLAGTGIDITERKQAEAAVRDSEAFLNTVIENIPHMIFVKDAKELRFMKFNKAGQELLGYSLAELAGKNDYDFVPKEMADHFTEQDRKVLRGQEVVDIPEDKVQTRDKGERILHTKKIPIFDKAGQLLYLLGISEDITERKQAEEKLKLFRLLIERSNDAIEVVDSATGRFLDANESGCRALGYTRDELLSLTVFDLMPEVNRALFDATNAQIKRAGHATLETLRRRKDGMTYPVEVSLSSVTLDREYTVAIVRDITERRKLEAQFRQAQKMEAIGQLAGGVAHDFNNILGVIIGYGDLIAEDLEPDSPLRKYVEEIRHAAVRATGLTQQLLVFSRKKKVQLVVLDLNDTVKNLDKMLRRLIGENIEMMVVPGKEIGRIKADTGYIGQVLMNLAVNARDAMPNGGKLTIATDNVTLDENYTRTHTGIIPGDYVMLTVSDTGTGMTKEVKARLFEALFTTKPAGKGTGLGLATCQTIVQQSGGHIDVVSEVGKGTTFKIYFPRVDKPVEVAAGADQTGPLPRGTETLLIVEDEPSVRHLAWKVLETLGYHVLRANNGQDALQMVREHKGSPIRLVVTDVIMPRMGGKVMADWLKTTDPDLKVLFTSGYTDDAIAKHGVLEPGIAFLSKPYTPGILARKVRAMLDNETDTSILLKQCVTVNQSQ